MMDNKDLQKLGQTIQNVYDFRSNDAYIVNQSQLDKFLNILNFFQDLAEELGGVIEPFRLVPKEEAAGLTALFRIFDVYGEKLKTFCKVMQHCSALSIDSLVDGSVCISLTVPHVFISKDTLI